MEAITMNNRAATFIDMSPHTEIANDMEEGK